MLQLKSPEDFVIGSGNVHTVRDFLELAFKRVNLNYKNYIKINKKLFRNSKKIILRADYSKAKKILNWKPNYTFKQLVNEMVDYDIKKNN